MNRKTKGCGILGVGMHVPEGVLSNADLEGMVDTTDEWIVERTGIRERRRAAEGENTSDLAYHASLRAIEAAGLTPGDIDLIICATTTPDTTVPNTACRVQEMLGTGGECMAFDLGAACTGWLYGATVATSFIRAGVCRHALVVGAETLTRIADYTQKSSCILFGDGAGAAVFGPTGDSAGLLGQYNSADGSRKDSLIIFETGTRKRTAEELEKYESYFHMNGREIFRFASRVIGDCFDRAIADAGGGMTLADVDLFFPHQANLRIIESAFNRIDVPPGKVFVNIEKYGNTSAASIPIALCEALEAGRLKKGDTVGMVAFGAGLTYGASLWIW